MQFGKMLLVGAAAFAMVLGTGCVTDDESLDMFKIKEEDGKNSKNVVVDNTANNNARNNNQDAELNTLDNNNNNNNNNNTGVGEWGTNNAPSPYDDFGTPISGLAFQPVYFHFDQSAIATSEYTKLDQVASYLSANAGTGVVIEGHCDIKGSDEYNRALGERRALAAKEYLLRKGIADNRIRTVSYGEEKPAGNDDALNRRDEFIGVTLKK